MVKVSYRKKVVALAQNMRAGEIIQSQDLIYITVPHREVNRNSILTTIEAIGARLRKNVLAKVGLNTQWLISKVLVKYGDKVKITFKRNGIFLSAEGQALGQGKRGDMIKVKNIRSRKILTGRIVAPNQVEMEF
jgi:flagella basal body P-ring formation protein FlgA